MVYIETIRRINELTFEANDNLLVIEDIHRDYTTRYIKRINNPTLEAKELAAFRTIIEYKTSTANTVLWDWKAHTRLSFSPRFWGSNPQEMFKSHRKFVTKSWKICLFK